MNPFWGQLAGGIIIVMMISFIGTCIWLWNARHKPMFDELARLPMEDDEPPEVAKSAHEAKP